MKVAVIGNGNVGMAAFGELLRMPEIRELALVGRNVERIRAEVDDYVEDCISKKVRINGGERPQYYVENNHPAIIDADTFAQVQEELARRASKRKVKQIGTTTEQGKYCGKYALTELLVYGECGTPYRRCTWTAGGQKRIVWRCINRLDYGKKYCHHSPTIEESPLQNAIMNAILKTAKSNRAWR